MKGTLTKENGRWYVQDVHFSGNKYPVENVISINDSHHKSLVQYKITSDRYGVILYAEIEDIYTKSETRQYKLDLILGQ